MILRSSKSAVDGSCNGLQSWTTRRVRLWRGKGRRPAKMLWFLHLSHHAKGRRSIRKPSHPGRRKAPTNVSSQTAEKAARHPDPGGGAASRNASTAPPPKVLTIWRAQKITPSTPGKPVRKIYRLKRFGPMAERMAEAERLGWSTQPPPLLWTHPLRPGHCRKPSPSPGGIKYPETSESDSDSEATQSEGSEYDSDSAHGGTDRAPLRFVGKGPRTPRARAF